MCWKRSTQELIENACVRGEACNDENGCVLIDEAGGKQVLLLISLAAGRIFSFLTTLQPSVVCGFCDVLVRLWAG